MLTEVRGLLAEFRQSLLAEVRRLLGNPAPVSEPRFESPYLNVDEAAAYCKIAVQTIYNHRSEIQRQPGIGKLLFTREALDNWLAARKRRR
ncbi:MAG: helix-turn-helix domain-containing protein [Planctomycetes bacterium]|nr:helix-turn-helix domain-containing protein [Planctomycetota bacterium]